tara:strand:- start:59 stop:1087 length:1029 start_codon:yes stop_codon:yes gene_type:complete
MRYLLIILSLLFWGCEDILTQDESGLCDVDYTEFSNSCYYNDDISVLNSFIQNSGQSLNIGLDDSNNDGEISWHELCRQNWVDGRLRLFSVFVGQVLPENNCNLSGDIPDNIGNWSELEYLDLGYHPDPDNTSGLLTGTIPESIGNLSKLESLYLYNNSFEGNVPDIFEGLTQLKVLWLCNNYFTGVLPESLWSLLNLEILYLEDNQFEGQINPAIINLVNLKDFWLNDNYFTGEIPDEIYNLSKLERLFIHNNQFEGQISSSISNLTQLVKINIQNNLFSGEFPNEICSLDIDFGYTFIDDVYYLDYVWQDFNIENNYFCPEYPLCIQDYIGEQNTSECEE